MLVVALPCSLFLLHRVLFLAPTHWCWPWPCQDSFLEPDFVSIAQSQLYYIMLAECQLIGVHDGLARVGCR